MSNVSPRARTLLSAEAAPQIPDVELVRPVGRGAYGEVWVGRNCVTHQLRAAKLIPLTVRPDGARAGREIKSLMRYSSTRVRHENLVQIDHVGQTDEFLFYLMEPADDAGGGAASVNPGYCPATLA